MNDRRSLIRDGLHAPETAIGYVLNESIVAAFPNRYAMRTQDYSFDLDTFVARMGTTVVVHETPLPEWASTWDGPGGGVTTRLAQGHRTIEWRDQQFDVIEVAWAAGHQMMTTMWWLGPSRHAVEEFAAHVAQVANEVTGEVLVFTEGCWHRSRELRDAIRSTTFENLVLTDGMSARLLEDFRNFLGARGEYERYGVPWKRGVLFVGPPGNGKTHCVKALLNALELPCLYVQSFDSAHPLGAQHNVRQVFQRARRTTPCALVLEDLDALVNDATRSFFLNEMDGFADNTGIVTIATTNHPERLDPAIVDRPSRFDRKYVFALPAEAERRAYLHRWTETLAGEARPGRDELDALASQTEGFSYAYVKELMLSSLVKWMSDARTRPLAAVATEQVGPLREQMSRPEVEIGPGALPRDPRVLYAMELARRMGRLPEIE